jgi:hypothetical protein
MDRTQGVTLVTLMPTGWSRLGRHVTLRWFIGQRSIFNAIRRYWGGQRRASAPPVYLEALNFIHFGRWIIINRRPWLGWASQGLPPFARSRPRREPLRQGIMIFTSNFDFDWRPYVDTFTETAVNDLGVFWDSMPGWQEPTKIGYRNFFEFVNRHSVDHDHYYAAFPDLATANIKSALFVDRAVRSFEAQSVTLGRADWKFAFDRMVGVLQHDLGTIAQQNRPNVSAESTRAYSMGGNGHLGLTYLVPVPRENLDKIRLTLQELGQGTSPFAELPGTHFGRLVVISDVHCESTDNRRCGIRAGQATERPIELKSGYILMSVDVDAPPGGQEEWLRTLYRVWSTDRPENLIDRIWGSCWGIDVDEGEDAFVQYMMGVSYKATVPFADYPHTSVWDIQRAVHTHGWFTRLVFDDLAMIAPRPAFTEAFALGLGLDPR